MKRLYRATISFLFLFCTFLNTGAATIIFENHTTYKLIATIHYTALSGTICKPHEVELKAGHKTTYEFPIQKALCELGALYIKTEDGAFQTELTRSKLSAYPMRIILTMNLAARVL